MARPKTPKGQSSPTLTFTSLPASVNPDVTADADESAPESGKLLSFSRTGVSITLPEAFWPRLLLTIVAGCTVAAGYILYDIAMDDGVWADED